MKSKPKLLIVGANEYGQLIKELAKSRYPVVDFLDDDSPVAIGKIDDMERYRPDYDAIVAIENPYKRKSLYEKLDSYGFRIVSIISPRSYFSKISTIEPGCVIEPMAVISANAIIKRGTFINAGAVINHNAIVNEFCQIDCNEVVCAGVVVPAYTHMDSIKQ